MDPAEIITRLVHRATAPLRHRLNMVVSRLVVDAVNDAGGLQMLQVTGLADETLPLVEHMQPGGLSHVPLAGAEGVLACVAGYRDHPIGVGVSNRSARPKGLLPGETVLYSVTTGTAGIKLRLRANGSIELTPAGGQSVHVIGNLTVTGEVTAMHGTAPRGLSTHLHPTAMGPSGPPTAGT